MILLMLDFDGTLVPIKEDPARVFLDTGGRELLRRIARNEQVKLAVISGRSLADVKRRVGVKGIIYAGCHGLEMEGPGIHFLHRQARAARPLIKRLAEDLGPKMRTLTGVEIEDKKLTLAVHYRRADHKTSATLKKLISHSLKKHHTKLTVLTGRKVYEIMPRTGWDKGSAASRLLVEYKHFHPFPIYIGDDHTDEHAFRAIKGRGWGILVENRERSSETFADYRLSSIAQVREFLNIFIQ